MSIFDRTNSTGVFDPPRPGSGLQRGGGIVTEDPTEGFDEGPGGGIEYGPEDDTNRCEAAKAQLKHWSSNLDKATKAMRLACALKPDSRLCHFYKLAVNRAHGRYDDAYKDYLCICLHDWWACGGV